MISSSFTLALILVPIPAKRPKNVTESESQFLGNWNRLSTREDGRDIFRLNDDQIHFSNVPLTQLSERAANGMHALPPIVRVFKNSE